MVHIVSQRTDETGEDFNVPDIILEMSLLKKAEEHLVKVITSHTMRLGAYLKHRESMSVVMIWNHVIVICYFLHQVSQDTFFDVELRMDVHMFEYIKSKGSKLVLSVAQHIELRLRKVLYGCYKIAALTFVEVEWYY